MRGNLAIIDVFSLLHRAFYALPRLTTSSGEVTNAVYGFAMMLIRIFEDEQPDYVAAAIDMPAKTFRHQRYEEYKANRKEMPDELRPQVERVKDVLRAFQIPIFGVEGYEADDLIGTLSRLAEQEGLSPRIYTGDRDALQLASEKTVVVLTKRGITDVQRYDAEAVKERYSATPGQFIDIKALMGDSSDNIPGVKGIGEKTAMNLVSTYGSLEEIYAHLDELTTRQKNLLADSKEIAMLSRELATIDREVPVEVLWEAIKYTGPDPEYLPGLFTELEFHNLLARLAKKYPGLTEAPKREGQGDLFADNAVGSEAKGKYISESAELDEILLELRQAKSLAVLGYMPKDKLIYLALSPAESQSYIFTPSFLASQSELLELISEKQLIGHDLKGLLRLLTASTGQSLRQVRPDDFDLQLASYLINPSRGHHSLGEIWGNFLGQPLAPEPEPGNLSELGDWLAMIGANFSHLKELMAEQLKTDNLWELFHEVEMPLAGVLGGMEERGVLVDRERLRTLSESMGEEICRLEEEIFGECGESFNVNSPKQLGEILFEKMGLPPKKKTKSGYSTSAEVLEELSLTYPFVQKILDYRHYVKLKGTYADALADLIAPDGRIHTTYNQTITATGRLSSTNPNLQNIPARTEEGRKIREVFIAPEGWELVSLDYSQIELRVLAHLSGDEVMLDAFQKGEDIHARAAKEVFGVSEVTPQLRSRAKAINFGIVYGISPFGLSRDTGISVSEAAQYIEDYFARYPKIKAYLDEQVAQAEERGYVQTILKRRRYLPDITAKNKMVRAFAQRAAMNTPIQGSAADIIKVAMLKVDEYLRQEGWQARMLLQIHDELVFEAPKDEVDKLVPKLKELMEGAIELSVPIEVDAKGR